MFSLLDPAYYLLTISVPLSSYKCVDTAIKKKLSMLNEQIYQLLGAGEKQSLELKMLTMRLIACLNRLLNRPGVVVSLLPFRDQFQDWWATYVNIYQQGVVEHPHCNVLLDRHDTQNFRCAEMIWLTTFLQTANNALPHYALLTSFGAIQYYHRHINTVIDFIYFARNVFQILQIRAARYDISDSVQYMQQQLSSRLAELRKVQKHNRYGLYMWEYLQVQLSLLKDAYRDLYRSYGRSSVNNTASNAESPRMDSENPQDLCAAMDIESIIDAQIDEALKRYYGKSFAIFTNVLGPEHETSWRMLAAKLDAVLFQVTKRQSKKNKVGRLIQTVINHVPLLPAIYCEQVMDLVVYTRLLMRLAFAGKYPQLYDLQKAVKAFVIRMRDQVEADNLLDIHYLLQELEKHSQNGSMVRLKARVAEVKTSAQAAPPSDEKLALNREAKTFVPSWPRCE